MKIEDAVQRAVTLLSLPEVAGWQVPGLVSPGAACGSVRAELPALQRGAVWRPVQVESLWDSIMRGFPIGSFMLMPYERALGHQDMLLTSGPVADPTHMLLDGQQRATSIALGFYKPWTSIDGNSPPAALWIDLGAPPTTERDFSFRLVTLAHPWGYPASGERQRLELSQMRDATAAFQRAQPKCVWARRPPVEAGWPWESVAPVPVAAVLAAASAGADAAALINALDRIIPHWREIRTRRSDNSSLEAQVRSASTAVILKRLRQTLDRYCVPAQTVSNLLSGDMGQVDDDQVRPDPTETLFIRLNSGGTPLQGEELIYSIAKAIWPSAPNLIQKIRNRFFSEARATLLIARLAMVEDGKAEAPAVPDVSRFRRLVHGSGSSGFRERMEGYLEREAQPLFEQAHALLTSGIFGLPPMLAADLARGESGRELMFLLLRWIERLNAAGLRVDSLGKHQRAKAVGALTAISWFARHPDRCVRKLWGALATTMPDDLPNFFNRRNFSRCLELVNNQVPMLYLPPPDKLRTQFEARITKPRGADRAFSNPASTFWSEWNWERFVNQIHRDLSEWYDAVLPDAHNDEEDETMPARKVRDWDDFIGRLYHGRNLVLFAQRQALTSWFDDFDPTDPDAMDEINRPWDMDHILPSFYIHGRQNIPRVIRDWHGSIGNLRAWPLDANRSDAETAPRDKLNEINDATRKYGMKTACDLRAASFIPESDWGLWRDSTPRTGTSFPDRFLALPKEHGECRKALIKAITNRTLALYTEWYMQMKIVSLMPKFAA